MIISLVVIADDPLLLLGNNRVKQNKQRVETGQEENHASDEERVYVRMMNDDHNLFHSITIIMTIIFSKKITHTVCNKVHHWVDKHYQPVPTVIHDDDDPLFNNLTPPSTPPSTPPPSPTIHMPPTHISAEEAILRKAILDESVPPAVDLQSISHLDMVQLQSVMQLEKRRR